MVLYDSYLVLLCFVLSFGIHVNPAIATGLKKHDETFVPDQVLRITSIDATIACTHRKSVVINGTTPGPALTLVGGKTTWVRVYNDMSDANTTIHWHGLSQSVAPFSDGTPLASQWPIPPKHYFDYELHPLVKEAGSYFYHSHVEFQAVSAAGPLLVLEPNGKKPPIQYDDERILFTTELYNKSDSQIMNGLIGAPFVWSGEPESLLLNGHGTPAPNSTEKTCGPEVIEVEPSKTYRFRFIGGVALSDINIAFEDHNVLSVVGADGAYAKPSVVDHMQVDSGQRFEVLFKTKSLKELRKDGKQKTDYSIQLQTLYRPTVVQGNAILRYKTSGACCHGLDCYVPGTARKDIPYTGTPKNISSLLPKAGDKTTNTWLEYSLTPLKPNNFPQPHEVTRRLYLSNLQAQLPNKQIPFTVNNHTWVAEPRNSSYRSTIDNAPILVDIYKNGQSAVPEIADVTDYLKDEREENATALETGWDPVTNSYPAAKGEVLEIILLNLAGYANTYDVHPWHAHGGHYYDIGSGPGMYDARANDAYLAKLKREKGYTPALRDSTMLYRWPADNKVNDTEGTVSGWRGWRIRVEDPGVWMIHCHTLQHMLMGMQTIWVMGNASEITRYGLPLEDDAYETFDGESVEGDRGDVILPRVADRGLLSLRSDAREEMSGYLEFGGSAYGNEERAPVVNHFYR